jgi:Ca-activated chloride channel homolog
MQKYRNIIFTFVLTTFCINVNAQVNDFLREGNKAYEKKDFQNAANAYNQALNKNPDSYNSNFNLGDALFQQKKYKEASGYFQRANDLSKTQQQKELSYYNLGNSLLKQNEIEESINAYKGALKINPDNLYAKYNLSYAIEKRKRQKKQQQQQQSMNMPMPDNNNNKNQQQKNKEDKNQPAMQNQAQNNKAEISNEEAEQILNALKNNEEKIRQRMYDNRRRPLQRRPEKPW